MNNQSTVRVETVLRFVVLMLIPAGLLNGLLSPALHVFSVRNLRRLMEKLAMMTVRQPFADMHGELDNADEGCEDKCCIDW